MALIAPSQLSCKIHRLFSYSKVLVNGKNLSCCTTKRRQGHHFWLPSQISHSPQNTMGWASVTEIVVKNRYYATLVHECWKCGVNLKPDGHQYFCNCGVVQPPKICRDYFSVMGMEINFDIDLTDLKKNYTNLQRALHPDKFSQRSETEKEFSLQQSSTINKAYNTLLKPLSRGLYMLELNHLSLGEHEIQMESMFLMKIMELNEDLVEADSIDALEELEAQNEAAILDLVSKISKAFNNLDIEQAKSLLAKLKYFSNIAEKVKDLKSIFLENT